MREDLDELIKLKEEFYLKTKELFLLCVNSIFGV
jgi:hypothetical protein